MGKGPGPARRRRSASAETQSASSTIATHAPHARDAHQTSASNLTPKRTSSRRRRGSTRGGHGAALHSKEVHENEANALDGGLAVLDRVLTFLKSRSANATAGAAPSKDGENLTHKDSKRDFDSAEVLSVMSEVIDERSRPSLEYALGVLGVDHIPDGLQERQRALGARAFVTSIRNRAVHQKRHSQEGRKQNAGYDQDVEGESPDPLEMSGSEVQEDEETKTEANKQLKGTSKQTTDDTLRNVVDGKPEHPGNIIEVQSTSPGKNITTTVDDAVEATRKKAESLTLNKDSCDAKASDELVKKSEHGPDVGATKLSDRDVDISSGEGEKSADIDAGVAKASIPNRIKSGNVTMSGNNMIEAEESAAQRCLTADGKLLPQNGGSSTRNLSSDKTISSHAPERVADRSQMSPTLQKVGNDSINEEGVEAVNVQGQPISKDSDDKISLKFKQKQEFESPYSRAGNIESNEKSKEIIGGSNDPISVENTMPIEKKETIFPQKALKSEEGSYQIQVAETRLVSQKKGDGREKNAERLLHLPSGKDMTLIEGVKNNLSGENEVIDSDADVNMMDVKQDVSQQVNKEQSRDRKLASDSKVCQEKDKENTTLIQSTGSEEMRPKLEINSGSQHGPYEKNVCVSKQASGISSVPLSEDTEPDLKCLLTAKVAREKTMVASPRDGLITSSPKSTLENNGKQVEAAECSEAKEGMKDHGRETMTFLQSNKSVATRIIPKNLMSSGQAAEPERFKKGDLSQNYGATIQLSKDGKPRQAHEDDGHNNDFKAHRGAVELESESTVKSSHKLNEASVKGKKSNRVPNEELSTSKPTSAAQSSTFKQNPLNLADTTMGQTLNTGSLRPSHLNPFIESSKSLSTVQSSVKNNSLHFSSMRNKKEESVKEEKEVPKIIASNVLGASITAKPETLTENVSILPSSTSSPKSLRHTSSRDSKGLHSANALETNAKDSRNSPLKDLNSGEQVPQPAGQSVGLESNLRSATSRSETKNQVISKPFMKDSQPMLELTATSTGRAKSEKIPISTSFIDESSGHVNPPVLPKLSNKDKEGKFDPGTTKAGSRVSLTTLIGFPTSKKNVPVSMRTSENAQLSLPNKGTPDSTSVAPVSISKARDSHNSDEDSNKKDIVIQNSLPISEQSKFPSQLRPRANASTAEARNSALVLVDPGSITETEVRNEPPVPKKLVAKKGYDDIAKRLIGSRRAVQHDLERISKQASRNANPVSNNLEGEELPVKNVICEIPRKRNVLSTPVYEGSARSEMDILNSEKNRTKSSERRTSIPIASTRKISSGGGIEVSAPSKVGSNKHASITSFDAQRKVDNHMDFSADNADSSTEKDYVASKSKPTSKFTFAQKKEIPKGSGVSKSPSTGQSLIIAKPPKIMVKAANMTKPNLTSQARKAVPKLPSKPGKALISSDASAKASSSSGMKREAAGSRGSHSKKFMQVKVTDSKPDLAMESTEEIGKSIHTMKTFNNTLQAAKSVIPSLSRKTEKLPLNSDLPKSSPNLCSKQGLSANKQSSSSTSEMKDGSLVPKSDSSNFSKMPDICFADPIKTAKPEIFQPKQEPKAHPHSSTVLTDKVRDKKTSFSKSSSKNPSKSDQQSLKREEVLTTPSESIEDSLLNEKSGNERILKDVKKSIRETIRKGSVGGNSDDTISAFAQKSQGQSQADKNLPLEAKNLNEKNISCQQNASRTTENLGRLSKRQGHNPLTGPGLQAKRNEESTLTSTAKKIKESKAGKAESERDSNRQPGKLERSPTLDNERKVTTKLTKLVPLVPAGSKSDVTHAGSKEAEKRSNSVRNGTEDRQDVEGANNRTGQSKHDLESKVEMKKDNLNETLKNGNLPKLGSHARLSDRPGKSDIRNVARTDSGKAALSRKKVVSTDSSFEKKMNPLKDSAPKSDIKIQTTNNDGTSGDRHAKLQQRGADKNAKSLSKSHPNQSLTQVGIVKYNPDEKELFQAYSKGNEGFEEAMKDKKTEGAWLKEKGEKTISTKNTGSKAAISSKENPTKAKNLQNRKVAENAEENAKSKSESSSEVKHSEKEKIDEKELELEAIFGANETSSSDDSELNPIGQGATNDRHNAEEGYARAEMADSGLMKESDEEEKGKMPRRVEKRVERRTRLRRSTDEATEDVEGERARGKRRLRRESTNLREGWAVVPGDMLFRNDKLMQECVKVWATVNQAKISIPFREPVLAKDAPNYFDIVKSPMDLSTVRKDLENKKIDNPRKFYDQMMLICRNALLYNDVESDIYSLAIELKQMIRKSAKPVVRKWLVSRRQNENGASSESSLSSSSSDDEQTHDRTPQRKRPNQGTENSDSDSDNDEGEDAEEPKARINNTAKRGGRGGSRKRRASGGRRGRGNRRRTPTSRGEDNEGNPQELTEGDSSHAGGGTGRRGRRGGRGGRGRGRRSSGPIGNVNAHTVNPSGSGPQSDNITAVDAQVRKPKRPRNLPSAGTNSSIGGEGGDDNEGLPSRKRRRIQNRRFRGANDE